VPSGLYAASHHPGTVVLFFEAEFKFAVHFLEDQAFDDWVAFVVGVIGFVLGEWFVHHGDDVIPDSVPVFPDDHLWEEDVGCDCGAEADWGVAWVCVHPWGCGGVSEEFVVSLAVGGAD